MARHSTTTAILFKLVAIVIRSIPFPLIIIHILSHLAVSVSILDLKNWRILNGELPQFIDHIGICTWEILRYYPIGMDDKQFQRLMLDKEQNRLLEEFRRTPGQTRQYGFMFTAPESNTKKCTKSLVVTPNGYLTYCPFSVWGLGKIEPTDTDDEITYKLQSKREEWAVLISSTTGFCPLQRNTEGYIDFFEKHGTPFQRPTGILDRDTSIHEHYRRTIL